MKPPAQCCARCDAFSKLFILHPLYFMKRSLAVQLSCMREINIREKPTNHLSRGNTRWSFTKELLMKAKGSKTRGADRSTSPRKTAWS